MKNIKSVLNLTISTFRVIISTTLVLVFSSKNSSYLSCQSSCIDPIYAEGSTERNFKRRRRAIGPRVKLDFVLPERCKNLKRGGKRGQTSSFSTPLGLVRFCFIYFPWSSCSRID